MRDERLYKFANSILNYSLELKRGDLFEIRAGLPAKPLIKALMTEAKKIGAVPYLHLEDEELYRLFFGFIDPDAPEAAQQVLEKQVKWQKEYWNHFAAHVDIGVEENDMELSAVDPRCIQIYKKAIKEVRDIIIDRRKWVYLHWPTMGQAQRAGMCYDDFFEFFLSVCMVDYEKMARDMEPLQRLMEKTDNVSITGPGTELEFSIKGIPVVPCAGKLNIPDGEIYTAPVRESVNGVLKYNTVTNMYGKQYNYPCFTFKNGKIVDATCENDTAGLNKVLDTDEGARYIGEFALGLNNRIKRAMGNTLYDEKIGGSIHFTPGNAYADAFNGNKSAIHWDIVCVQTPEFGGGEIYFDDVLVRKDGKFMLQELAGLNE